MVQLNTIKEDEVVAWEGETGHIGVCIPVDMANDKNTGDVW